MDAVVDAIPVNRTPVSALRVAPIHSRRTTMLVVPQGDARPKVKYGSIIGHGNHTL